MAIYTNKNKTYQKPKPKNLKPPTISTACTIEEVTNNSNTSFEELLQLLKESHQDRKRLEAEKTKSTATIRSSRIENSKLQAEARKNRDSRNKLKSENQALMEEIKEGALDAEKTRKAVEEKEEYKARMVEAVRRHNELEDENASLRGDKLDFEAVTAKLGAKLDSEREKTSELNEEIFEKSKQCERFKGLAKKYQERAAVKNTENEELKNVIEQSSSEFDEEESEVAVTAVCNECVIKKGSYAYCPTPQCSRNKKILAKTLARVNHECGRYRAALTYANSALRTAKAHVQIKYDAVGAGFYAEAVFTDKNPKTNMKLTRYSKIESGQYKDNEHEFEFAIATCSGNPLNPNPSRPTREQVIENARNVMGKALANKVADSRVAHVDNHRIRVKPNYNATRKLINEARGDEEAECNKVVLSSSSSSLNSKKVSSDCRRNKRWEFTMSSDCRVKK